MPIKWHFSLKCVWPRRFAAHAQVILEIVNKRTTPRVFQQDGAGEFLKQCV